MKVKELIRLLQAENPSGDMTVKISSSILDEYGVDVDSLLVNEYDDGDLEYEVVILGDYGEVRI